MSALADARVTRNGWDFWVQISHGLYQVEEDDRDRPPLWKAYDQHGFRVGHTDRPDILPADPLDSVESVCAAYGTAEEMVAALLACDGAEVAL